MRYEDIHLISTKGKFYVKLNSDGKRHFLADEAKVAPKHWLDSFVKSHDMKDDDQEPLSLSCMFYFLRGNPTAILANLKRNDK